MSLKITSLAGTFDLPPGFNVEIEDTSPIFNDRGSQSTAATLPTTKNNLHLTNHINRPDNEQAPTADARVIVSDDVYRRTGKMNITQASHSGGIVSNIGFDESEIYNIWNAISLRTLKGLPVYSLEDGTTGVISYLNDIMTEKRTDTPFHVFPICVAMPSKTEDDKTQYYSEMLNSMRLDNNKQYTLNGNSRIEIYLINNEVVETSVPEAYGITPFLKVSWLLNYIFDYYGYRITDNPFSTHPQLSRLVVLNNAADCGVKGFINYADLMPDCTINEFLQALYCRFGMIYFVDGKTKTVRLKFIKDIIATPASQDWSKLKASEPVTNYNDRQQLKLSAATSISGPYKSLDASPTSASLDKFLEQYGYIVAEKYGEGYLSYSLVNGTYCIRNIRTQQIEAVSSDFFPWDKGDNIGYYDISSVDECLPMTSENYSAVPGYLLGKIHRYTNISSADVELPDKSEANTPLCFCFSMPVSSTPYPYGTPRCTGPHGENVIDKDGHTYDISMTFVGENGLFNRFWKGYDAILRHANNTIETELHLTHNQLINADFSVPVSMDGQRLLIDTQRYLLPLQLTSPVTINLRTLKLLKPFDLEKEQSINTIRQLYKWVLFNNRESVVTSVTGPQVNEWRTNLASNVTWLGVNRKNEVSDNVSDAEIPFTVPTKEDFDSQHSHFVKQINYSFDLYYRIRRIKDYTSQGLPIYEEKEYGGVHYSIKYNMWIKADRI